MKKSNLPSFGIPFVYNIGCPHRITFKVTTPMSATRAMGIVGNVSFRVLKDKAVYSLNFL